MWEGGYRRRDLKEMDNMKNTKRLIDEKPAGRNVLGFLAKMRHRSLQGGMIWVISTQIILHRAR